MVLVVGPGIAEPPVPEAALVHDPGEVGVLPAVADVLLAESADPLPRVAVEREAQRPEEVGVGAVQTLARIGSRPPGVGRVEGLQVGEGVAAVRWRRQIGHHPRPHDVRRVVDGGGTGFDESGSGQAVHVEEDQDVGTQGDGVPCPEVAGGGQGQARQVGVQVEHTRPRHGERRVVHGHDDPQIRVPGAVPHAHGLVREVVMAPVHDGDESDGAHAAATSRTTCTKRDAARSSHHADHALPSSPAVRSSRSVHPRRGRVSRTVAGQRGAHGGRGDLDDDVRRFLDVWIRDVGVLDRALALPCERLHRSSVSRSGGGSSVKRAGAGSSSGDFGVAGRQTPG